MSNRRLNRHGQNVSVLSMKVGSKTLFLMATSDISYKIIHFDNPSVKVINKSYFRNRPSLPENRGLDKLKSLNGMENVSLSRVKDSLLNYHIR